MDAPRFRRLLLLSAPLAALTAGSGCGGLTRPAVHNAEDDTLERGQAPEGPLPPVALPPQGKPPAPIEPLKSPTEAPVVPVSNPVGSAGPVVAPVEARVVAVGDAATRVKAVATIGSGNSTDGSGGIVTEEEVGLLMKQRANEYFHLKGEERERKEREVYRDSLRMLVERELILTDFLGKVKKNKPQVLPELWETAGRMADNQLRQMREGAKRKLTEAEFAAELEAQGLPYKPFRRQIERASLVNMLLGTMLRDKAGTPTLAQVQEYYERHKAEFKTDDKVKYLDLFVSTSRFGTEAEAKRYADELFQKALSGADFVTLVKQFGHGDSPLRDGAGVGEKRGEIQPAALEETVFGLKPGNISGVVATETGYHILKVTERQVAGYRPFDEKVQSDIRNKLMDRAAKSERDKMVAELWRKTGVIVVER
jgi:parvulin-like peptidyl-prolyl isomerase